MEQTEMNDLEKIRALRKRLNKVLNYASNGFYITLNDEDKLSNRIFLEIIKETYNALQTAYALACKDRVEGK